jgi:hypothetical protein
MAEQTAMNLILKKSTTTYRNTLRLARISIMNYCLIFGLTSNSREGKYRETLGQGEERALLRGKTPANVFNRISVSG